MMHTPGPWTWLIGPEHNTVFGPGWNRIATVHDSPRAEADSLLIASAPEARALLARLVAAWDGTGKVSDVVEAARELLTRNLPEVP